ncbi:MAG: hypothetical protein QOF33_5006, partial [Thermomicrobiales bacterium]|nr:hypothetical protein [Thermomicrobiales bacterium]
MPEDAAKLMRFDDFLDALVGEDSGDTADLDPELVEAARRLHAAPIAASANPGFASTLRRSLLSRMETADVEVPAGSVLRAALMPSTRMRPSGRWWPRAELAAMVLIVAVLVSILAGRDGSRWSPSGPDDGGFVMSPGTPAENTGGATSTAVARSRATEAPPPEECDVEPRSVESLRELSKTLVAGQWWDDAALSLRAEGAPADEVTVNAIAATVRELAGCINANDYLRITALQTDEFVKYGLGEIRIPIDDPEAITYATPGPPVSESDRVAITVDDVEVLSSGRARGRVVIRGSTISNTYVYIFERVGDRWLIDWVSQVENRTPTLTPTDATIRPGDLVFVSDNAVNLRSEPSTSAEVLQVMLAGAPLLVTGDVVERDGVKWLPVKDLTAGTMGYIGSDWVVPATSANNSSATTTATATRVPRFQAGDAVQVTTSGVPLRAEPSIDAEVLRRLAVQTRLVVVGPEIEDGVLVWWPVAVAESGERGYVLDLFLE